VWWVVNWSRVDWWSVDWSLGWWAVGCGWSVDWRVIHWGGLWTWAIGSGVDNSMAIVCLSVGWIWLWGLINRWDIIIRGVCWWDIVWNISWLWAGSLAGGVTVDGAGVDLGRAVLDVIRAGSDGDVFVASVSHHIVVVDSWRVVCWWGVWGSSGVVDWLLSAGRDGGVDLGLVWVSSSSGSVVHWLFVVDTSKGRADNSGGSSEGGEMHFELYYYLGSVKEY